MRHDGKNAGFTLIELLVVMSLFMVLAGLVIAFMPGARDAERTSNGAQAVQGALNISKQRAMRDQAPRGVRFFVDNATGFVTELLYIEQPEDLTPPPGVPPGGQWSLTVPDPTAVWPAPNSLPPTVPPPPPVSATNATPTIRYVKIAGVDLQNGSPAGPPAQVLWTVQQGDYLEFYGGGTVHIVRSNTATYPTMTVVYDPNTNIPDTYLLLNVVLPRPRPVPSTNWRIIRQPRPTGEDSVKLPKNVVVDTNINLLGGAYNNPLPPSSTLAEGAQTTISTYHDVLFAPDGRVVSRGVQTPLLVFWVRDITEDPSLPAGYTYQGNGTNLPINSLPFYTNMQFYQPTVPSLVGVNVYTGLVASHDPAINTPDPYAFLKDGRSE
jgi:prepilin-type N-terminal cleavage/methylation domain-containing protein